MADLQTKLKFNNFFIIEKKLQLEHYDSLRKLRLRLFPLVLKLNEEAARNPEQIESITSRPPLRPPLPPCPVSKIRKKEKKLNEKKPRKIEIYYKMCYYLSLQIVSKVEMVSYMAGPTLTLFVFALTQYLLASSSALSLFGKYTLI